MWKEGLIRTFKTKNQKFFRFINKMRGATLHLEAVEMDGKFFHQ